MASVVAKAGQLKPDIRLAAAISHFEADLTTEQKTELHKCQSEAAKSPPTTHDVMRFIAEIKDRTSRRGGRCLSTRLINVLKATQGFAALGDIIVGGSQNLMACGVWSLVRMSLASLVAFASYVDKLTEFFMMVGRSAPCYENMTLLYPRSKNLQSYLIEYFVVIVDLCHRLLKLTKQSILQQLTSFWNPSDLESYKLKLDSWGHAIRMEVDFLTKKSIENQGSRLKALTKFSRYESLLQRQNAYHRVLDSCSQYDHQMTWKEIRKMGNTTLFQKSPEYMDWKKKCSDICTLVCIGKLGSGKSVWLANMVEDLNLFVESANYPVTFFFCQHDISESLKARTVIGSLARQLLASATEADFVEVERLITKSSPVLDFDGVVNVLRRSLPQDFKGYFVLDGLDECNDFERRKLTEQLWTLQKEFSLSTCISLRLETDNATRLKSEEFGTHNAIAIPEGNPDIEEFVSAELEKCLEAGKLVIRDLKLILEIQDALLAGSQGMFLWVSLQIETLCTAKTDGAIRDALADLPKSLPETYTRILQKSGEKGQSYQARIFELITVAHRPLTVDEFGEALSVVPGDTAWNPNRIVNDINAVLAHCGSLIYIDEEMLTVRLFHHSVKQFLLGEFSNSTYPVLTAANANASVAAIIVTYLNYNIFETQVSTTVVPKIMAEEVPSKIVRSINTPGSTVNLAIRLLRSRKQTNVDIGPVLAEARNKLVFPVKSEAHFYSYAKSYWQQHACFISQDQQSEILVLLKKLVEQEIRKTHVNNDSVRMLLLGAVEQHNVGVVNILTGMGVNLNAEDTIQGRTALLYAIAQEDEEIVEFLLRGEAPLEIKDPIRGQTPLLYAAHEGYYGIFKRLLEKGAALEAEDDVYDRTSLSWAARKGHIGIVELIRQVANLESRDYSGATPVSLAAMYRHVDIVKSLSEFGANLETGDSSRQTPLSRAAKAGETDIIRLLIDLGAELEAKDVLDDTPLLIAVRNRQHQSVRVLIANGASIEAKNRFGRTPLSVAMDGIYKEDVETLGIVEFLLEQGANLDMKEKIGGLTPLAWATKTGNIGIVRLSIEKGADIETEDGRDGMTPLIWAVRQGHLEIVEFLLKQGANLEVKDTRWGRTSLLWASMEGRLQVVKLLLEQGANLETKDDVDQTPLMVAVNFGHKKVVKLLLDKGANIYAPNKLGHTPLSASRSRGNVDFDEYM